ncbi:MAG: FecR family protein, partial [Planctomycetota bacterium]
MNDSPLTPQARLRLESLIDTLCDQRLDAAGFDELNALLAAHEEARRHYLYRVDLHHTLRWNARANATHRAVGELIAAGIQPQDLTGAVATSPPAPPTFRLPPVWIRHAVAAVLFIGFAAAMWLVFNPPTETSPTGAQIAETQTVKNPAAHVRFSLGAKWGGPIETTPAPNGGALRAGVVTLEAGIVKIELTSGANVTLRGPARLKIQRNNRVVLLEGDAVALTPPRARGFVLETPGLRAIDAGSEFGVHVDPERHTKVVVFRGEAHTVIQSQLLGEHRVRLTRDDGLTLDAQGVVTTAILGDASRFASMRQPEDSETPTVANPGFEYPRAVASATHAPAGWTLLAHPIANADSMEIHAGLMTPAPPSSAKSPYPRAAEGRQWAYLNARTYPDGRVGYTSMHQAVG